jgi:hypothetical protein
MGLLRKNNSVQEFKVQEFNWQAIAVELGNGERLASLEKS